MALTKAQLIDLNANELIIDLDADTSITADTDDQIDIKIAGADDFRFTANTFTALAGSTITGPTIVGSTSVQTPLIEFTDGDDAMTIADGGVVTFAQSPVFPDGSLAVIDLDIDGATDIGAAVADADLFIIDDGANGTNRKVTAARVKTYMGAEGGAFSLDNLDIDGATDIGAAIVDADLFIVDDGAGGTNRKTTAARVLTYIESSITTTGALNSGSITSGFGAIDNGTSNIRSATITAETAFVPDAANGATLGTTSLEFADLFLHDGAQILFGADQDVLLTHVADAGLTLKTATTSDDTKATLTLQTGDTDIAADDVLGQLHFQAPDEGAGTDAILVAAGIAAISEGDFSASNNATKLSFQTGASEAASEKMSLSSAGVLTVSGAVTSSGIVTGTGFTAGSAVLAESELELLDGLTAGTAIASKVVTTDASIDTTGQRNLTISGELDAATLDISGNADIDGTTNLDAVDIDGAVQLDATLTVGANDQGYDIIIYGDTASANLTWDTSVDDLIFNGAARAVIPDGQLVLGSTAVTSTAAELNKLDGAGTIKQAGKETIWVPAVAMYPSNTGGSAALTGTELASDINRPFLQTLAFDKDSDEAAQFSVAFPKSWNEGTITFQPFFTANTTNTGDVKFMVKGVAISDDGAINVDFGTAQGTAKSHSGTAYDLNVGAESSAITIAGSPAAGDQVFFQIFRDVSADNMSADALLTGIKIHFTTDAANDA